MTPYLIGDFFDALRRVNNLHPDSGSAVFAEQGMVTFPDFFLKFQMFIDFQRGAAVQAFLGDVGVYVKKKQQFRGGKGRIQAAGKIFAAFYALINQ